MIRKNASATPSLTSQIAQRALFSRSIFLTLLGAMALSGCVDLTVAKRVSFRSELVETNGNYASPGHVYTMRGLFGVFSRGMDTIAARSEREIGVRTTPLADPDWKGLSRYLTAESKAGSLGRPLILIGHSFGADDQVRVAIMLDRQDIPVDLLILVDPDTPPSVPANVKRCVDIYKSHPTTDVVPMLRGIKVRAVNPNKTELVNIDVRTAGVDFSVDDVNHINIDKKHEVQEMVLAEIKKTCFP